MMSVPEEKTISVSCPYCEGAEHKYKLRVVKTLIVRGAGFEFGEGKARTKPDFTRIFICPKTGKKFEADFELWKDSTQKILSVDVIGLAVE